MQNFYWITLSRVDGNRNKCSMIFLHLNWDQEILRSKWLLEKWCKLWKYANTKKFSCWLNGWYWSKMVVFVEYFQEKAPFFRNGKTQDDDHHLKTDTTHYSQTASLLQRICNECEASIKISNHAISQNACLFSFLFVEKKLSQQNGCFVVFISNMKTCPRFIYKISSTRNLFQLLPFKRYESWHFQYTMNLYFDV